MKIVSARNRPTELHRMCEAAEADSTNNDKNLHSTDWEDRPHSLLYKFYGGGFQHCVGDYLLLYEGDSLVAGSGYYAYDRLYVLGLIDFYVMPDYERKIARRELLFEQLVRASAMSRKMLLVFDGSDDNSIL